MSAESISRIIYTNCIELLKFRGHPIAEPLEYNKTKQINSVISKYITIKSDDAKLAIIYYIETIKSVKTDEIEKVFNSLNADTIVVAEDSKFEKMQKSITNIGARTKKPFSIIIMSFNSMIFNMPTHESFVKYEKMSDIEIKQFEKAEYHTMSQLPKIKANDVNIKWYGFKSGDYVKAYQPSVNCGTMIIYKQIE